jgi:hypothetical protein
MVLVVLAAGCGGAASGATSGELRTPTPEESMSTDQPASPAPAGLECGAPFEAAPGGALTITGHFAETVSSGALLLSGTVEVAAAVGRDARGVVTPQAEAFLVRDGRIVTLPTPQDSVGRALDLTNGRVERLPATATLVPCAGGSALATGRYDLYVRVVLNNDDGSRADSFGGPWPLEVG